MISRLEEKVSQAVEALDYTFWGCVIVPREKGVLLRIYIDKPGGVTVDDCAKASHQINGVLAVSELVAGSYTLEVSSPGLDRTLFKLSQYEAYIGCQIKLRLKVPFEGQRNFQGVLESVDKNREEIVLRREEDKSEKKQKNSFNFDEIEHANLLSEVGCEAKKGAKR